MILKLGKNNLFLKNYFKKIVIFGLVFGIFLLSSNFAEAAQFGRPNSTISAGSWTAVGAPQLWQTVDEVTANDDTDYAEAAVNTTAEFGLSSVPDPGVSTGHIVRWRYKPAGAGTGEYIVVNLYQGATLIRSSGNISGTRGVYNDASFTLTNAEADSITNYGDLRLMINTTNLGGGESMRVTWLELEVPSNTSPSLSISQPDGVDDTVTVGDLYNITYTLSDPEETVNAAFYYDTDNTGLDGTAITGACASAPEGTGATCSWDTTGVNAGSYYIYGITSDGVNPQVSAYSLGQITINITIEQEILNKVTVLETKVDTLQTKVDQMPQSVWEYANRSLTSFGTLASDIWSYSGRSLDNVANITQGVWEYSTRSLTSFGTLVSDIWSYSGRSLDNVANITQGVWEYSDRTLTSFGTLVSDIWSNSTRTLTSGASIAQDIWNATTRKLTSRQIAENEYIAGVTDSGAVSQVADQPTQENVEYNVELVRKATFDFAGIADGGSTLTLIDAELDQPDDYWGNYELIVMSGVNIGQKRAISGFDKNTNAITVSSAFSSPIASGDKYVISHEGKLVNAIWSYADRTLTGFGTLAADIWSYPNRTLTSIGSLAADVWNDTFAPTRRLTDSTLTSGGQLATTADLNTMKADLITEINENQALIVALNNISASDVWSYGTRNLTGAVDLTPTSTKEIWNVAKANLTAAGSIGEQVANNLDAAVSSRSTLTAADVWSESTRTLTDYATSSISLAVWSEATRELTNYGNNITAADVWNTLSNTLTLQDSIGKQLATNIDTTVSSRGTVAGVWASSDRTLSSFGTLVADIWSNPTRTLSAFGSLAADIWNNTFAPTRRLTDQTLTGGGSLATQADITAAKNEIIALINGLNNISAANVWAYSNRSLTDPDSIWEYALTQIGNSGSIGMLLKDNINATISSRGTSTLTANDVWDAAVRTLTANTNLGISTPAQIADAIWDEATADHVVAGSTGKALTTAGTGGAGAGGLKIETHTVSEFEQGDTAAAAVVQVLNNGIPVSGITPVGTFYKPNNSAWAGHENVNFTEIPSTGIYTYNFDTTAATLGVYKLAVSAAQSTGGSSYSENFTSGTIGQDMTGWANTGATYSVQYDQDPANPTNKVYHKSDYGGFHYAYSNTGGSQADFTYTAKVWMPSLTLEGLNASSDYVGITFRYSDSSNNYDFYFRRAAGNVRLRRNGATLQESPSGTAFNKNQWYTMKVVVTEGHIQGYVDDVLKVDYTDSNPLPDGKIGLFTYNSIAFWDDISVTAQGTSQYAYIAKDFAIVSPKSTQASINALNNISAADVWNVATSTLTTAGSIGKAFADNRMIQFAQDGELLAGSGTNNYKAKLYLYNLASQPVNAVGTPSITIKNASGGTFETGSMDDYSGSGNGIYEYITTIGSGQGAGRWEAIVTVDTGGANPIIISGYFEVEASPARVTINSITYNTVPSITANFAIANEGTAGYEYHYKYCVVDTIENVCDGVNEIAWGQGAEWIESGVEEQFNKTLTVNTPGTYIWKVVVYWGTEKSVAALQFDAVSGVTPPACGDGSCNGSETCSICPADCGVCGGGGGGGGGGVLTPTPTPAVCSGADFNHDGIVNSVDFSILLYFWKTQPPFRNSCVDINKDAQVNSVDFSILLYQWGKPGINIK